MTDLLQQINFDNINNDLSGNTEIIKNIISIGDDWYTPKFKDIVSLDFKISNNEWLHYTGTIETSVLPDEVCEFIQTMKLNEYSKFKCKKDYIDNTLLINFCKECSKNAYENSSKLDNQKTSCYTLVDAFIKDVVVIEIKLNTIYSYTYLDKDFTKYVFKKGIEINSPLPYDEISIKYCEESIIDNNNCLDNIEIDTSRLNLSTLDNRIKSVIVMLKKDEICVLEFDNKKYTVHLLDWNRIYMINLDTDVYMKKIVKNQQLERIGYEYDVTYELDNQIYTNSIGGGNISIEIEKCLFNMYKNEEVIIYNEDKTTTNLKLIDFKYADDISKLDKIAKFDLAMKRKCEGNELYKKDLYNLAITKYKYAIEIIKQLSNKIKSSADEDKTNIDKDDETKVDNEDPSNIADIEQEMDDIKQSMTNIKNRMNILRNFDKPNIISIKHDNDIDNTLNTNLDLTNKQLDDTKTNDTKLDDIQTDDKSTDLDVKNLHILLMMNICQCFLKIDDYSNVIIMCAEVLKLDSNNFKTLYRKGYAYLKKNDTDRAKEFLLKAKNIEPSNNQVIKALILLKDQIQINNTKDKEVFKDIFK